MIKIDPSKAAGLAAASRVAELRKLLADSDFKAMPDYDKPNADILEQRQAWRDELRALEAAS